MKRIMLAAALAFVHACAFAATPKWKADFPKEVNWIKLGTLGTLFVSTDDALYGIDPADGKVKWKHEILKKLKQDEFELVEGTPFMVMKRKEALGHPFNAIIDETTGKLVLNTREIENCLGVSERVYLPELNAFFFMGLDKKGKNMHGLFDIKQGRMLWFNQTPFPITTFMLTPPTVANDKTILIATTKGVYSYDVPTGAAKKIMDESAREAKLVVKGDAFYLGTSSFGGYKTATGSPLFPAVKTGQVKYIMPGDKGYFVATDDELQYFGYTNGQPYFSKEVKLSAPIVYTDVKDNTLLLLLGKENFSEVKLLDLQTGAPVTKKQIDYKSPINFTMPVKKGLYVRTGLRLRLLDPETGKSAWKDDIDFKSEPVTIVNEGKLYAFDNKYMYTLDLEGGAYNTKPFKHEFESETPAEVEMIGGKFLLKSSQNMTMVDMNGEKKYHTYYAPPGQGAFAVIAMGTLATANTVGTAYNNASNAASAQGRATSTGIAQSYSTQGINNSVYTDVIHRKFKATKEAGNYVTVLAKINEDGDKGNGLVKLNKENGQKVAQVVLNDKKPVYELDPAENMLYYVSGNKEISGFVF